MIKVLDDRSWNTPESTPLSGLVASHGQGVVNEELSNTAEGRGLMTGRWAKGMSEWSCSMGGGGGDRERPRKCALRCGSSRQEARFDSSLAPSLIEDEHTYCTLTRTHTLSLSLTHLHLFFLLSPPHLSAGRTLFFRRQIILYLDSNLHHSIINHR